MESISHEKDAVNTTQCRIYIRTIIPTNLTFFQIFFFSWIFLPDCNWLTHNVTLTSLQKKNSVNRGIRCSKKEEEEEEEEEKKRKTSGEDVIAWMV